MHAVLQTFLPGNNVLPWNLNITQQLEVPGVSCTQHWNSTLHVYPYVCICTNTLL